MTKENGNNVAVKYIRYLKKVTRIAIANKWMDEDPFINKRYTRTQARREALNEDELKRIMSLNLTDLPSLEKVRDILISRMKADYARYDGVVQRDKDGNPINNLTVDTCNLRDEQNMGIHLQGLAFKTDTQGQYKRIGEVYDFPISIISERTVVDGKEYIQNRFVVEGNYKYKFNNGFIAMSDTHAACMNFVNALEKIPGIIAQYEERTAKLKADVPQLEAIVAKQWGKEDELKQLKSELAALDRKITAALAPKHDEQDGEENRQVNTVEAPTKANDSKKSMVAEPRLTYSCNKKYYL